MENVHGEKYETAREWNVLYRIAGSAAIVMVLFIPLQILIFLIWPPPTTVTGWFELFHANKLVGLIDMDLLLIVDQIFVVLILLGLSAALRHASMSLTTTALGLGLIGVAIYFSSTVAFEMLRLSDRFAAATTEIQKAIVLAAGEALLVTWGGTAFNVGYICEGIAFLLIGLVMLRSRIFGKVTAWSGVLLGVLSLVPPTVPAVGMFFAFGSLLPLVVWDVLIGVKFFRLAKA